MQKPPIPSNEKERLAALKEKKLLDTPPEERFDKITREATQKFDVPISTVTLVDKDREWYKSAQGLKVKELPRDYSFCSHAMMSDYIFMVEDTEKDERFADNPQVSGDPKVRFYAGMKLLDKKSKLPIGVFCIKDTKPRQLTTDDVGNFLELAKKAEEELNK